MQQPFLPEVYPAERAASVKGRNTVTAGDRWKFLPVKDRGILGKRACNNFGME
jgi:hypothetical protein